MNTQYTVWIIAQVPPASSFLSADDFVLTPHLFPFPAILMNTFQCVEDGLLVFIKM